MKKLSLAFLALALAALACSIFVGGPKYPATTVPVSNTAAQSLNTQATQAAATAAVSGTMTLTITQEQLTSYLAQYLQSQSNSPISDPQVQLQNGQMKLLGKVQQGMFTANVSLTLKVSVDQNGQPQITITQEDFGPFPAPQGLNDAITAFVTQTLTGSLGPAATGFRLESISIADGVMTVTGRTK